MRIDDEIEFCRVRESEERTADEVATSMAVHDAHSVMAERYAGRASSLSEQKLDNDNATPTGASGMTLRVNGRIVADELTRAPSAARDSQ